jgi:arsenate reductase
MGSQIQIFGTKKCKDTQKALRFFKERNIKVQFVDFNVKEMSPGELDSVSRQVPLEELIDENGKEYEKRNLKYMEFDIREELLENPLLFRTPVSRYGKQAAAGHTPDIWKKWAGDFKS